MGRLSVLFVLGVGAFVASLWAGTSATAEPPDPYASQVAVDENPDPSIFETSITAMEVTVDIGNGVMATMQTYNGTVPGPEIRVQAGDRVIVHFTNELDEPVGIHWHGIELANHMDGTPFTQNEIQPGASHRYDFIAPRPGIHWYHPHHHFSTNQVFKGLYGAIVVEDPNDAPLVAAGTLPGPDQTMTLVLSDTTVCQEPGSNDARAHELTLPWAGPGPLRAQGGPTPEELCESPIDHHGRSLGAPLPAGSIPNIQKSAPGPHREGQTVLTNGHNVGHRDGSPESPGPLDPTADTVSVRPGQGVRLQVVGAAPIRFYRLKMTLSDGTPVPLVRVGGEGGLLNAAKLEGVAATGYEFKYEAGEVFVDPGDRVDLVAAIPAGATGVATLWTLDMPRTGSGWSRLPTVPVAHFQVEGDPVVPAYTIGAGTPLRSATGDLVEVLPTPTGALLDPAALATPSPGMVSPTIALTNIGAASIDGVPGAHDFAVEYYTQANVDSTRYARVGDVLELTVENTTVAHHPFHLHGFSFQPLEIFGCSSPVAGYVVDQPEFADNFDVPPECSLRLRVRLDDRVLTDGITPGGALGRWMFHCHIFFHHHLGMFSELVVTDENGNQRPYIDTDQPYPEVTAGQVLIQEFTVFDPDGDTMTVTSSAGTVTGNGDGTWTLSYRADLGTTLVHVTVTDSAGNNSQATIEVTGTDPAPVVEVSPDQVLTIEEGGVLPLVAQFTDEGGAGRYQVTIDYGDGAGPQPVEPVVVAGSPTTGSVTDDHAYGDNGVFRVRIEVTDPSGHTDSVGFDVTVENVAPRVTTPPDVVVARVGEPVILAATVDDPGSDDLTTRWTFGDGSPDDVRPSLVNPPVADPPSSPSIQPRSISHDGLHWYDQSCVFTATMTAVDDDGGSSQSTMSVIVIDTSDTGVRSAGFWSRQVAGKRPHLTSETVECYLQVVVALSGVFSETTPLATFDDATSVLAPRGPTSPTARLDRQLLAAWLNVASGSLDLDTLVDTDGDGIGDATLEAALAAAEGVRLDPTSSRRDVEATKDLLESFNT